MRYIKKRPYIWFILPGAVLYITFMIVPLISSIQLSFFNWDGISPKQYVGFENYVTLFTNARFSKMVLNALANNIKIVLVMIFLIMPIQIFFAYMFNQKIRGYRVFQMLTFLPYVLSPIIVGFFVMMLFNPYFGIINTILTNLGLKSVPWLGDPNKLFTIYCIIAAWQGLGVGMMIFLSNMKSISGDVLEASIIDGANERQKFFHIVLPLLTPSLTNLIVLDTIWGLTIFDLPFVIGGPTGGVNGTLDFMNLLFYRYAFGNSRGGEMAVGFASSISSFLFVIIMIFAAIQSVFLNKIDIES